MANPFSSGALQFFPSFAVILLVVWCGNSDCSDSSKVYLLNDDTYQCDYVTIIMSSFGQLEQGAHQIKKFLIYSMRKVFLERAVVKLALNSMRSLKR